MTQPTSEYTDPNIPSFEYTVNSNYHVDWMICPECGFWCNQHWNFCPNCGKFLQAVKYHYSGFITFSSKLNTSGDTSGMYYGPN